MMEKSLSYQDVYLVPRLSRLKSRTDAQTSINWGGFDFSIPTVPANMSAVINKDIAFFCSKNKIPYFYHRFGDTFSFVKQANNLNISNISISVGVKESDRELLKKIRDEKLRVDMVLIDIAHGFSVHCGDMISFVRSFGCFVVAGNVYGDKDSIEFLQNSGCHAIKIGLSFGAGCSTYAQTGFGSPMFSAALEAGKWSKLPLIIDGGIRTNGDVAKAICAVMQNADAPPLVMIGSLFAACIDAPGENVYNEPMSINPKISPPPIFAKLYRGSASAKEKGHNSFIEGKEIQIPCNGITFAQKIQELRESLQSSISYAGGFCLNDLNIKYVHC